MKKKITNKILAEGEVTGHAHRVEVDVYEEEGLRIFDGATAVTHEEHRVIELPEKEWASSQVQEYDYLREMKRPVQD